MQKYCHTHTPPPKKERKLGWPPTSTLEHNRLLFKNFLKKVWPKDYTSNQTAGQIQTIIQLWTCKTQGTLFPCFLLEDPIKGRIYLAK